MPKTTRAVHAFIALAATAVLVYFGTGLHPWWPLLWFAPLPVLLLARQASARATGIVAVTAWTLGNLNLQHYFGSVLHAPVPAQAVIFITPAIVFALSVLLFRALLRRGAYWSAMLAFPATYTSFEYLLNLASPHGTAGSLAYSQLKFLPFLQLASITGPWGMTFFLLLFSSTAAVFLALRTADDKLALNVLRVGWGCLVLILIFGAVRLALPAPPQSVRVGLIASDAPGNQDVAQEGAATERLLRDYAAQAEALAVRGAQVIVMPEKIGVILDADKSQNDAILQAVADKTRSTIVVGVIEVSAPYSYNQARIYAPGAPPRTYNKQHMLPPFESRFLPGNTLTVLEEPPAIWGVTICKDMDFTPLSRHYGWRGAGLMLVPAWDFVVDRSFHGHMAVMRGVEDGFTIARAARGGYLTVSDNRGRILAETTSDAAPFATLVADVPTTHDHTLYLLLGNWFAWAAIAILLIILARLYAFQR